MIPKSGSKELWDIVDVKKDLQKLLNYKANNLVTKL